jgi:predicted membrane metal-binding protein
MDDPGEVFGPIFFFLAVFGIVAMTMWRRLHVERERQQTIRLAIEKGQPLDPALVEKMMSPPATKVSNPFTWPVAILSSGVGLAVFGLFMRQIEEDAFWPLLGSGSMIAIIGAGLFLNAYLHAQITGRNGNNG